jgi:multiple sugar transport system ATP-binding protein
LPAERTGRYRDHVGNSRLLFGLRPEHITDQRATLEGGQHPFEAELEVVEPMGMETIVHFLVDGTELCGRVGPYSGAQAGRPLKLVADLNSMHLIDDSTGRVD